jgi:hypothetical protein
LLLLLLLRLLFVVAVVAVSRLQGLVTPAEKQIKYFGRRGCPF